ncbi:MAG: hypothetical protein Q9160_008855, partial [Pyrenula sp. 1 TL-2023]
DSTHSLGWRTLLGIGTWTDCGGVRAVPVTEKDQVLGVLNIQDPRHLKLKVPSTAAAGDHHAETSSSSTQGKSQAQSGSSNTTNADDDEQPLAANKDQAVIASPEDQGQGGLPGAQASIAEIECHSHAGTNDMVALAHDGH